MSNISIIGTGNMAGVIGARAVKGDNAVEVIGRDASKAKARVAAFVESLALRPLDVGGLTSARRLEGASVLLMRAMFGKAVNSSNFSIGLSVRD
jgi:predicted dinucleotide-binding enzyme